MKRKVLKTVFLSILAFLLVCILVAATVVFWYFPHYTANRRVISTGIGESGEIKMMSYNLRCLTPLDLGKKSWFYRADLVLADIEMQAPGIIGFQEATRWQYNYLVNTMPEYDSVITYRDDSVIAEGCPIFYHTGQFELIDKGSFWLSETPDVMSKDWGAAHYRICSYVILMDKATDKAFVVFNTHLDHVSDEARIKGIQVVLDKIGEFGGLPAVIMGDLNAQEGSLTYVSATENFLDARYEAAVTTDSYTYHGWGDPEKQMRIDYFMISKVGFTVHSYDVLTQPHEGVYSSDHAPLVLALSLS